MSVKKHRKLKIFLTVAAALIIFAVAYTAISNWADSRPDHDYTYGAYKGAAIAYPDVKFAVISDLHMYDPSLGSAGAAFEKTMNSDRKLLLDSEDLLDYAIEDILKSEAEFVLISGDLTKDGELVNHEIVAEKLGEFKAAGLGVYVVPGNHDVNNPDAVSYDGDGTTQVDTVMYDEFAEIYRSFGYGEALFSDTDSLSYVAEPVEGLWILALDACRSDENQPGAEEIVGGRFSGKSIDWIAQMLTEAQSQGKAVVAMMHHGVAEHWEGKAKLHPDYLIEDFGHFGAFLASHNVRLVFTGHYHAHDITRADFEDGKYIYDVATGSLITAPCPIRYCSITDNVFAVESEFIVDKLHPGTDFAENATAFVKKTVVLEAYNTLKKYKVSDKDSEYIADAVGDGFVAHYSGDEVTADKPEFDTNRLGLWGRIVYAIQKYVVDGLWVDLPPGDINVSFALNYG